MQSNPTNETVQPRPHQGEAALFRRYNQYLRLERGFSDNTLDAYLKDLQKLLDYYETEGIDFRRVTLEQLQTFVATLMDVGISPRSVARILSGVHAFYRFLVLEKELQVDPTELLDSPSRGHHLPDVLSVQEIDLLISSIDMTKAEGQRDRAILETLYSCGLRVSELCHLKMSDLFLPEGFIRVHGKGKKERLVPISPKAIQELELWFTDRESGAMRSVPRDGARLCRNKLRLLAKRRELDEREGGSLGPLFEATCVLSALEMLAATVRGRLPRRDGFRFLREYLSDPFARRALRRFPLSLRRPAVAASVLALRLFA